MVWMTHQRQKTREAPHFFRAQSIVELRFRVALMTSSMRRNCSCVAILAFAPLVALAGQQGPKVPSISDQEESEGFSISTPQAAVVDSKMSAEIEAKSVTDCSRTWRVFTDFDAMPRFLPGMEASKVLSREGGQVTVMQRGRHRYGILSKRYESKRELTIREPELIESRSLPGDEMAIVSSTIFKTTAEGGCAIAYSATIELPAWLPGRIAEGFVKSLASTQMRAMLAEVHRRYPPSPAPAIDESAASTPAHGISSKN